MNIDNLPLDVTCSTPILTIDALVRAIGIHKGVKHALFLGAGASITSGMPSAASCIWEWKRSIFLTNNPGLEPQFSELSLGSVKRRIQDWLDSQRKYPAIGSTEEYGFYIEACYPILDARRAYFAAKVRDAKPFIGYQLLAELAREHVIGSVWTTNFDCLASRAAHSSNVSCFEVGIDSQKRIHSAGPNDLLCVSMHGEYRYDHLKNTPSDLRAQEIDLEAALIQQLRCGPTIVCGYSGRDESIMAAFEKAYANGCDSPLYWCDFGDSGPSPEVDALLDKINKQRNRAYYVPSVSFDDLMRRLALHLFTDESHPVRVLLNKESRERSSAKLPFTLPDLPITGVIKSNAYPLKPPSEILQFDLIQWPAPPVWAAIEEIADRNGFVAAPHRGKIFAFATPSQIHAAFGANLKGKIERVPIDKRELQFSDSFLIGLIRRALVQVMAAIPGVKTDNKELLWRATVSKRQREGNVNYCIHDALILYIRDIGGQLYSVFKPTLYVSDPTGNAVPKDIEKKIKTAVLGWQHNKEFDDAVMGWRSTILKGTNGSFVFPKVAGEPGFEFTVSKAPLTTGITDERSTTISLSPKIGRLVTQKGLQLPEPALQFANHAGQPTATDVHPVRGLVSNRPFDYSLTASGLLKAVKVAIICPSSEIGRLHGWLNLLQQPIDPGRYEGDYLPRYPGFTQVFGLPISIPLPSDSAWKICTEPQTDISSQDACIQLARHINESLSTIQAAHPNTVVLIYIPGRWQSFRGFDTETEHFDLHDFVKAYAVRQNIATQFLEEETLTNPLQCRIRWWLSLALYVKGMRTPWALNTLDRDTAFVGLGFSQQYKQSSTSSTGHIVLGCSHLYDAQGQGLQFRLNKIENPIFRARNPYMSLEDARRVGENIRELFFESRMALPKRVVIHKQTPFLNDERAGLEKGLAGVDDLDLLEIFVDDALRYVASKSVADKLEIHGYPIQRGTTVIIDDYTALVWVHGSSKALNPRIPYYQGKRRIPAPLVIRRHSGRTDLMRLVEEILGLSKMNWNSFDLYSQLPATITSSRQVAQIGGLLNRFSGALYDYRLFM